MVHILYNDLANNNHGEINARKIISNYNSDEVVFVNITKINDVNTYLEKLGDGDSLVLAGGDGTLNNFINAINGHDYSFPIYCYAAGSGNDFMTDVKGEVKNDVVLINKYIKNLPTVTVYGENGEIKAEGQRFINGIGYGIDGYCCEVGDELKKKSDKPVNYAGIAIKGMLFHFKPCDATVTVDGVEHKYKKVWLAPTMNGRYYGGGMMVTPEQNRLNGEGLLSVQVFHGSGKIKTLMIFPKIFKGEHVLHKDTVEVLTGHEITVEFTKPCALQIDGETITRVLKYTAKGTPANK